MTVEVAIQQALNGISFGALLFILAAGLSLIFGMMDVINLAHGAFYMLGAYIALAAVQRTGNFWLALIRAGVDDAPMLAALGVDIDRVFATTFAAGAALAAIAGVIAAPVFGVFPGMDVDALIYSLIVVVVGGLGTLSGAIAGGALVGPADTFGKVLFPQFALALIFAIVAFVLLLRPTGLLVRVRIAR